MSQRARVRALDSGLLVPEAVRSGADAVSSAWIADSSRWCNTVGKACAVKGFELRMVGHLAPNVGEVEIAAVQLVKVLQHRLMLFVGVLSAEAPLLPALACLVGVDPVWWTPIHLRRRCHQCRRVSDLMRRNSGDRWLKETQTT